MKTNRAILITSIILLAAAVAVFYLIRNKDISGGNDKLSASLAEGTIKVYLENNQSALYVLPRYFSLLHQNTLTKIALADNSSGQTVKMADALNRDVQPVLPSDLISKDTSVDMYIYKKSDDIGPSEAVVIQNKNSAEQNVKLMSAWEGDMAGNLRNFVLVGEKFDIIGAAGQKHFATESHGKTSVRYIDFTDDKTVGLRYYCGPGYIIISNSLSIFNAIGQKSGLEI